MAVKTTTTTATSKMDEQRKFSSRKFYALLGKLRQFCKSMAKCPVTQPKPFFFICEIVYTGNVPWRRTWTAASVLSRRSDIAGRSH